MTINTQDRTAGPFAGNDVATVFPFEFKVFQSSDLLVFQTVGDSAPETLILDSDYSVTLNADQNSNPGGSVVLLGLPLATGSNLDITSSIVATQPTELTNQGGFFPKVIENALDRLTILFQQLGFQSIGTGLYSLRQVLRYQELQGGGPIPLLSARRNKLFSWDSNGDPSTAIPVSDSAQGLRMDLANPDIGPSIISWSQGVTGAKTRTAEAKMRDIVSAADFVGFDPTGTTDSSPAVNAAFAAFPGGVSVFVDHGATPLFDTDINPSGLDNCALIGQKGALGRTFAAPNLNLYTPRVSLNRSATINLSNSCAVIDLPIFAKGLQFSSTRAVVDGWTGSAVTLMDQKSDQVVRGCLILGFEFGVRTSVGATRSDRAQIDGCNFDCLNAVYIENSYDVPKIHDCHGWPWVTLGSAAEPNDAHLKRPGAFVWLVSVGASPNDWGKVSDCFNFGWKTGFRISGADAVTLLSCSADNPPGTLDDSIGFVIEGFAIEARLIGCQAAGRQKGYYIATTDVNGRIYLTACNSWETTQYAMHIVNGDVNSVNCGFRNTDVASIGVYAENTITKARFGFSKFNGFSIGVHTNSNAVKVFVDGSCDFTGCAVDIDNPYFANITPSGDSLPLDGDSTFFGVSGTSTFKNFAKANRYSGRLITTRFFSALSIGTGGNTSLTSPLSVSAGQSVNWVCDGVNFHLVQ